eukprot:13106713-Alexandrium_andersonii.AAC.1
MHLQARRTQSHSIKRIALNAPIRLHHAAARAALSAPEFPPLARVIARPPATFAAAPCAWRKSRQRPRIAR